MVLSLKVSYWLTLALAVPAAGFLIRIFIICHDCGHGSFTSSRRFNNVVGFISGMLAFTPYHYWSHKHAVHHASSGDLDRRGSGDVWTLTLQEYQQGSWWLRLRFRLFRNPITMLVVGPLVMFLIAHRFAEGGETMRWHRSVMWNNLVMLGVAGSLIALLGFKTYLMIQLPVIWMAGFAGIWLFYVQHQFEDVYWERNEDWEYFEAGLKGSSYYKLPRILQWFSGNIGFHHIHHLSPRIPNYSLEQCHNQNPLLQKVRTLNFWDAVKCLRLRVWDEERKAMVSLGLFLL